MDRYSFLVRILPPLLHAGLPRRTNIAISLIDPASPVAGVKMCNLLVGQKSVLTGATRETFTEATALCGYHRIFNSRTHSDGVRPVRLQRALSSA